MFKAGVVYDLLIFHADDTEAVPPRSDDLENTVAADNGDARFGLENTL